jgi:hypothetical protein
MGVLLVLYSIQDSTSSGKLKMVQSAREENKYSKIHCKHNVLTSTAVEYLTTLWSQISQLLLHFHLLAW